MTLGDRATHYALLCLREVAGETRITNNDPAKFKRLMQEVKDAADEAGVDLKTVYAAVLRQLDESNAPLAEKLRRMSISIHSLH
jgi:hypothetical protein